MCFSVFTAELSTPQRKKEKETERERDKEREREREREKEREAKDGTLPPRLACKETETSLVCLHCLCGTSYNL
jgi:hypothetical protein